MKGIIFKTFTGWNISYDDTFNDEAYSGRKLIPISNKEPYNKVFLSTLAGDEFKEVEFEIIEEYVEPEGIHCNRGDFVKVAIITNQTKDAWDEIFALFSNPHISFERKKEAIRERYECPIVKK
jgi:hypothetical protein